MFIDEKYLTCLLRSCAQSGLLCEFVCRLLLMPGYVALNFFLYQKINYWLDLSKQ